jgi:hypothetical protein
MALQTLVGAGLWLPTLPHGYNYSNVNFAFDNLVLAADEDELQIIGTVHIDGGGSKTFGTSGSKIDWLPGGSITFAANSTLTVGVKKASTIDTANGPPARATIGAAAFDVSKALVGGTDTITAATWRSDAMAAGTPYTVTDGDMLAVCWHLDRTAGSPSIIIRGASQNTTMGLPCTTLVTAGPAYAGQAQSANVILTFDDGTLGWIDPSQIFSVIEAGTSTIGNGNIVGNVFRVPYPCTLDMLAAIVVTGSAAANFALELYSTPLGTPSLVESIACDANVIYTTGSNRWHAKRFATPRTLLANTDYAIGLKQTTATAVTTLQYDVSAAAHFKPNGMGAECYAANSTAAATFAAQNSGKRRYLVWARVSALDDGASVGGGGLLRHPGMMGGVRG